MRIVNIWDLGDEGEKRAIATDQEPQEGGLKEAQLRNDTSAGAGLAQVWESRCGMRTAQKDETGRRDSVTRLINDSSQSPCHWK